MEGFPVEMLRALSAFRLPIYPMTDKIECNMEITALLVL